MSDALGKILIGVATVAVGVIVGWLAYKAYVKYVDRKVIREMPEKDMSAEEAKQIIKAMIKECSEKRITIDYLDKYDKRVARAKLTCDSHDPEIHAGDVILI